MFRFLNGFQMFVARVWPDYFREVPDESLARFGNWSWDNGHNLTHVANLKTSTSVPGAGEILVRGNCG